MDVREIAPGGRGWAQSSTPIDTLSALSCWTAAAAFRRMCCPGSSSKKSGARERLPESKTRCRRRDSSAENPVVSLQAPETSSRGIGVHGGQLGRHPQSRSECFSIQEAIFANSRWGVGFTTFCPPIEMLKFGIGWGSKHSQAHSRGRDSCHASVPHVLEPICELTHPKVV
jgi:hypothetical protein